MNLDKIYYTTEGEKCNILKLVKLEPEWAANQIQKGDEAIEKLKIAKKNFAIIEKILNNDNTILSKLEAGEIAIDKLNRINNMVNDFCPDCREVKCIILSDD